MTFASRRVFPHGLILRGLGLMLVYTAVRILFFAFNYSVLKIYSSTDLLRAFALGFRFDAWIVSLTLLPLFLLKLWSWKSQSFTARWLATGFSAFVLALHAVFLFLEVSDSQYFKYSGRRTTLAILKISGDAFQQSVQLLINFWHVPVLSCLLVGALFYLWRQTRMFGDAEQVYVGKIKLTLTLIAGLCLGVLGLRGGLQTKPIAPAHAMLLGHSQLAALALSTSFQLTHSADNRELKTIRFFEKEARVREILELPRERFAPVQLDGYNVVILVVESLSMEYLGYRGINTVYAPFLHELSKKSLFFDNAYANGRQSIEAFPSILASMPSMVGDPFITSQYSSVTTQGLGHVLAKRGYQNAFFHGAKNGSMYIDSMAKMFGFPQFFGRQEYPNDARDFDGSWGIYDEPFLQFAVDHMNQFKQPFATGIFTLSSHNPFHIPRHLRDSLSSGKQPFHKSLAYTDYAIRRFFESAATQPWFNKTIFVVTGDHTSELESEIFMKEQSIYRVPIMFYDPSGLLKPKVNHRILQHTDIFPTLLDLLGIDARQLEKPLLPFGQSGFAPERYARAANRGSDWFWYQEGRTVVRLPGDGSARLELVDLQEDTLTPGARRPAKDFELDGIVNRAEAYLQFFNNRMARNSLFEP